MFFVPRMVNYYAMIEYNVYVHLSSFYRLNRLYSLYKGRYL